MKRFGNKISVNSFPCVKPTCSDIFLIVALITFFLYENAVCAYASFPH